MIKIYHNPRCSKSRHGVQILEQSKVDFEIIKYINEVPTHEQLKNVIKILGIQPIELVRKGEKIWKENFKEKKLTDLEIIQVMIDNPKLIERPIVINGNKAVVARPPEKILEII